MVKRCAIPANFKDEMNKDQIIFGIIDNALRERIVQEKSLISGDVLRCVPQQRLLVPMPRV